MTTQTKTEADLTPIADDVDRRFAGERPSTPWLGYVVEDSVRTAIEAAVARPQAPHHRLRRSSPADR